MTAEGTDDASKIVEHFATIQKRNNHSSVNLINQGSYGPTKDCTESACQPQPDGSFIRWARCPPVTTHSHFTMKPPIEIEDAFYPDHEVLFRSLVTSIAWDDRMSARRTASFGRPYNYSQMDYPESAIPSELHTLLEMLNNRLGIKFNNCLLNFYETCDNTMGFHSDETTGLVSGTGVAIVSLGSTRDITYRFKIQPEIQQSISLKPGSLLYMDDVVQENWMHAIKRQRDAGPRISLTWRAFR